LPVKYSIVKDQTSSVLPEDAENQHPARMLTFGFFVPFSLAVGVLVGLDRLELSTSPLSGVRSSHLSYRPGCKLVELVGIEPATS
jgi:hypothetical protein